jgi:hypothetical protein
MPVPILFSRRGIAALGAASVVLALRPAAAQGMDEVAARLAALEVRVRNQPVTAATLGEVQSISFGSRIAPQVTDADIALFRHPSRLGAVALDGLRGVTPDGLKGLGAVPQLWRLSLRGSAITDAHAAVVSQLPTVRVLDVSHNATLTDAAMPGLPGMRALTDLAVEGTAVSDAGIAALRGHPALQRVNISSTRATDACFESLAGIPTLQTLSLNGLQINGSGFRHLAGLRQLQELGLMNTQVDDAAAAHIGQIPLLVRLFAWHTRIGDAGLLVLAGIATLTSISSSRSRVTAAGVEAAMALPNRNQRLRISN